MKFCWKARLQLPFPGKDLVTRSLLETARYAPTGSSDFTAVCKSQRVVGVTLKDKLLGTTSNKANNNNNNKSVIFLFSVQLFPFETLELPEL